MMPPTVSDGDNAEFQYMAYILGVPHSTGYPLYILLAKLFTFLPVGDVAYRVTLFSVVTGALTAPIVYAIALRLIRRRVSAFLAALILLVTPSMWGGAIETKAYALHLFLGVLAILFALRWLEDGKARDFFALAFVYGLNLTNHPTIRFLAPALLLVVWFARARFAGHRALLAHAALLVLVPLVLYAYIPIRANQLIAQQDPQNWALYTRSDAMLKGTVTAYYNNTPQGFINLISGLDNSYKIGFKSEEEETTRVNRAGTLLLEQFGVVGIAFAIFGARVSFRRDRRAFALLAAIAAGMGGIALYLRGISTVYYFSLFYFVLAIWIGFGIDALWQGANRVRAASTSRLTHTLTHPYTLFAVLLLLPLTALVAHINELDQSRYYDARDFARAALADNLLPDAVVIAPWEVSQPMRYFQFVESVRPDLLIVNVAPNWPQFITLLENARKLNRPFYQIQFVPEDFNVPGPRSVQATPLPLRTEPQPRYRLNKRIVNEVEIIGYDLEPDLPQPGQPARVLIYYRALARVYPMYSTFFGIHSQPHGQPVFEQGGFPGSQYYQTFRWQPGDIYREAITMRLPADTPSGSYQLDLYWYVFDLETRKPDYAREFSAPLGVMRVGDIPTRAAIAHPAQAPSDAGITFLGWNAAPGANSDFVSVARGANIDLDLFWRADSSQKESYTVFVHLVDSIGRVVTDADGVPSQGNYPTTHWIPDENFRDRHVLTIPPDLAPGDYAIKVGMYLPATNRRLRFSGAGDEIVLTRLRIR